MRILITGGAGFIGSRLARRLVGDGHSVVVLDSLLPQVHGDAPQLDLPECEFIKADVRDADAVTHAMKGMDVVHHLAAETGVGQSQYEIRRYVSTNTYGTSVVLEAAVMAKASHVVIASSRAVYGEGQQHCSRCGQTFSSSGRKAIDMDAGRWNILCPQCKAPSDPTPMTEDTPTAPSSIYGITKLQQEQLALSVSGTHELPVTILRFFNVFGPGQSLRNPYVGVLGTFFRRVLAQQSAEIYEDGLMLRDFIFVDDVVEVLRVSSGNQSTFGQTLNVGTGIAVNLQEAATEMFLALGSTPDLVVSGRYRLGDVRHAVADISRLISTLQFRPQVSFVEGLKQYVEWALANQQFAADGRADEQLLSLNLLRQGGR
jgi:dTDP-L-rhamnose 4-epimerase